MSDSVFVQKVMGSHTNFYLLILSLIRLKDEFHRVNKPNLQPLIQLLYTKSIKVEDSCEKVPSNKELAIELDIAIAKCNLLLKQLIETLFADFQYNRPIEKDKVVHHVIIMLHYDEWKKSQSNKDVPSPMSINLQLKEIPRIGEEIEFEVVPGNYFERGIVHRVIHKIEGKTQIIEIHAHPWCTEYDRWMNLKEEYKNHQRWLKKI